MEDRNDFIDEPIEFVTSDPLGRNIILKTSTWEEHIKDNHPEKGISMIKNNLENPRYILKNSNGEEFEDSNREVYWDLTVSNSKLYAIKTVVDYKYENNYGEVVTNYILRKYNVNIEEGGIIYDSSTQKE